MARKVRIKCPLDLDQLRDAKKEKDRRESWFAKNQVVEKNYEISAVTPVFGGGVQAGVLDDVTLVRGALVRGHLRFWWRALFGPSFSSVKDMQVQEGMLWGTTEKVSPAEVAIDIIRAGVPKPCAGLSSRGFPRFQPAQKGYVLFPFQGNSNENIPVGQGRDGLVFKLTVRCPLKFFKEIEAALRAWILFGGIGARTRRGCGSLYCKELSPSSLEELENISSYFTEAGVFLGKSNLKGISSLPQCFYVGETPVSPEKAWMDVIGSYKKFRQGEGIGRNPGCENRPARSRWPEPESIRRFTGHRYDLHRRMPEIPDNAFPRALFGLPIIFEFKDRQQGDPQKTELTCFVGQEKKNRMASPLILKPLALGKDRAVPMVMVLHALEPKKLGLFFDGGNLLAEEQQILIKDPSLQRYRNSPMQRRSKTGNALEAFVAFAREEKIGREVGLS